jgi:hypothetical protein
MRGTIYFDQSIKPVVLPPPPVVKYNYLLTYDSYVPLYTGWQR